MTRSLQAGAAGFLITLIVSHFRSSQYNNFVLLADAFWHGRTFIDWPGPYIDALLFNGAHYVIEAPMPALLLMPFEKIFGLATNQTLLAVALAGIATGAAWRTCELLGVPARTNAWLCAFLLAGTDLLWCAMLGDVWFIAHVASVCFTMLAICESVGSRRGWLVALWAVCAIESRFAMVMAVPVYAYLLLIPRDANVARRAAPFAGVLAVGALLWTAYNLARWGTVTDIGYAQWYHQDQMGLPDGSPFRLMYLPYELRSFFVALPDFQKSFPYVVPPMTGIALTWTSPALILALLARAPGRLVGAMWVAAALCAAPSLLYYVNGFSQFGMRHALDFIPFLFVLMALGVRERLPVWGQALIAYSVAVGLWGCWYWNVFMRATS